MKGTGHIAGLAAALAVWTFATAAAGQPNVVAAGGPRVEI
jgi:hypothetical protein